MESLDEEILRLLARDGRISYTEIGRLTGLSTSAAQQRVRRLEQRGIITGYRAQVDAGSLGKTLTAFISLTALDPANDEAIPGLVEQFPEVVSCYSIAGAASYLLVVTVATPGDLEGLLTRVRTTARVSTQTTLVLSVPFADRPVV